MDPEVINPPIPVSGDEQLEDLPGLPYASVDDNEYREVIVGPRFSSCHSQPQVYYGPVTIRNYMAGHVMQSIRKSIPKTTPQYQSVFNNLPPEIQLMVFEHLHPLELYHISLASKSFRKMVMDPKAIGIWRMAFQRHPDLPNPPPGVSERRWTFMLFGPGICVGCGKYGALTDFAFLKQYCEVCMKVKYAYPRALKDSKNNTVQPDHLVCSLVPRSYRYHGLRYATAYFNAENAKYRRNDFNTMMRKVTLIQLLIDHGVPRLAELFDEYKTVLTSRLQEREKACNGANTWANELFRLCSTQYDIAFRKVYDMCKKRLLNLGHEEIDINFVQYSLTHTLRAQKVYKFTTKAFRLVRPQLEVYVTNQKVSRLKRERQRHLEGIYRDYEKALSPEAWDLQPPAHLVKDIEGFSEFFNAPYVKRGDLATAYAVPLFPEFVANWTKKNQQEIVRLLHQGEPDQDSEVDLEKLELATSVITCKQCSLINQGGRVLLGWRNICCHKRVTVGPHLHPCSIFEVKPVATAAAASIISFTGLDPKTTTIQDMNTRSDRFMCGNCLPETSHGITGLKVYTWTECITHSMDMHILNNPAHASPLWFLLTPEAAKFVIEHEYAHPRPVFKIWRCNHCASHYDDHERVIQKEAIDHVKQVHLIQTPVIGVDVTYARDHPIKRRKPFRLGTEPAYELKCQRCPPFPISKLWEMQKLLVHLRVKHKVPDPIEGEDWTRIQIIATTPSTDTTSAE